MPDEIQDINTGRVIRSRANAAVVFAILGFLIALSSLMFTLGANNKANDAQVQSAEVKKEIQQVREDFIIQSDKASTGAGVGLDNPIPAESGNTMPNANGQ